MNNVKTASGCLVLFGIPFFGMGLFFAVMSVRNLDNPRFQNPWIGVIFGSGFALIGLLIMAWGFQVPRRARQLQAIQSAHPTEPWMWRDDWAQGRAIGQSVASTGTAWMFAIFWNGISWFSVWAAFQKPQPSGKQWGYLVLAIFPAVGIGLFVWAMVNTLRRMRFGKTAMQLQTVPAALGGDLRGTIDARLPYPLPHGINLALTCVNRVTSGSGNNRSTFDHIVWQGKQELGAERIMAGPMGSTIPVDIEVPRNLPGSSPEKSDNQILWLLRAEADLPGVDFDETYEVPVFETSASPTLQDWQAKESAEERTHPATAPIRPTVEVSSAPEGGTQFYFPAGRNASAGIGITVFALIFSAVDVGIYYMHAPILFPIVFGFFTLLLWIITLNLWFGSARIVASSSGVTLHTNVLGIHSSKQWAPAQIQSVYPKITMQSGGGGSGIPYYTATIQFDGGKEYSMGNPLRDHNEAEWVCAQIQQAANVKAKSTAAGQS